MCIIDCLSTIVFILPLHLDYTKVIILILWWRNFQLEYWRTFQLVSTFLLSAGAHDVLISFICFPPFESSKSYLVKSYHIRKSAHFRVG